ncbi:MAG: sporulation integral membrane protein YlbJ [Actinobacteria bacterium]|nr:sporulation integral membrane protein YlbJ [Actinomycetota bacterium]
MPEDKSRRIAAYLSALGVAGLVVTMVVYPHVAFEAALRGLKLWWNNIFPALLPFLAGTEMLAGLGLLRWVGPLLEPVMRPLFNLPGAGAWPLVAGVVSGYPGGAALSVKLRSENLCTRVEGQRLLALCSSANPLFMTGTVAVGLFGLPDVAVVIVAAHYLSILGLGILFRFYGREQGRSYHWRIREHQGRRSNQGEEHKTTAAGQEGGASRRPMGQILGDSVKNSVAALLLLGGYIVVLSVVIAMLGRLGLFRLLAGPLGTALAILGIDPSLAGPVVESLFEPSLGAEAAGLSGAPLVGRLMVAGAAIAWSGLPMMAQVSALIAGTDLRILPFVAARAIQAGLAALFTALLLGPGQGAVGKIEQLALPALAQGRPATPAAWLDLLGLYTWLFAGLTAALLASALIAWIIRSVKSISFAVLRL